VATGCSNCKCNNFPSHADEHTSSRVCSSITTHLPLHLLHLPSLSQALPPFPIYTTPYNYNYDNRIPLFPFSLSFPFFPFVFPFPFSHVPLCCFAFLSVGQTPVVWHNSKRSCSHIATRGFATRIHPAWIMGDKPRGVGQRTRDSSCI